MGSSRRGSSYFTNVELTESSCFDDEPIATSIEAARDICDIQSCLSPDGDGMERCLPPGRISVDWRKECSSLQMLFGGCNTELDPKWHNLVKELDETSKNDDMVIELEFKDDEKSIADRQKENSDRQSCQALSGGQYFDCFLPFNYYGFTFYGCTTLNYDGTRWCGLDPFASTYGICQDSCPKGN